MKIVVTGGAGFIGRALAEKLVEEGHEVVSLDLDVCDAEGVHSIIGDITYLDDCRRAFEGAEVVYHLAAKARIPKSFSVPEKYYDINVHGTHNIVRACIDKSVKRVVYASSSTVYGEVDDDEMMAEDDELKPINWYGMSKRVGEDIVRMYPDAPEHIIARFFTVYGDGQPLDDENALVFGKFLNAKKKGMLLPIHGDGFQTRDFIDIRDVADAMALFVDSEYANETYNIGTGRSVSIKYLAELFDHDIMYITPMKGYSNNTKANVFKMFHHYGWVAKHRLEDGVKRMLGDDHSS